MIFSPSNQFKKKAEKLPKKIQQALVDHLRLFSSDPFNVLLNNHLIHGSMRSYRSINVTGDWRLIYEQYDEHTMRLIDIDTHSKLYGK
ncbi:MAG: type II toxin-antitoxin system mRNA interferase toxin, RelE/StbE family [Patescibacteria group bacterium]|nr:type II toxin-antitoxin system mRNA interferase toxin, RelE/StbE family [Patescibacteria group bacterium]